MAESVFVPVFLSVFVSLIGETGVPLEAVRVQGAKQFHARFPPNGSI